MSLFKILPWFSYQCPDNEEENYSTLSMTCGRLNPGDEQLNDNIIVSSHSGYISILQPTAREGATQPSDNLEATPNHSSNVYEAKLTEPILGVLCGNFLTFSQRQEHKSNNIAVLHPRHLVIYSLVKSFTPHNEQGQQAKLQMLLQHDLPKSAFTFCKGSFGGVKGKEYICVMFLDGSLKFFEQDGISHNCLLPGSRTILTSMIYIARTDCFVMLSPNWDLECYRYLSLSESFERKFSPIWSVCVGEYVLDLNSHQISNTESLIVLLGENNLICISDTGKMRFIKKLDYTPLSFCSFVVGWHFEPGAKLMIAVATENGSLLIYSESTLVWCAELIDVQTISFQRGNFSGLAGGLVTLTATGKVTVGFLGSSPMIFKVPPMNLTKLDYYKSKTELEEMETEINSSVDNSDVQFINESAERDVQLKDVRIEFESIGDGATFQLDVSIMTTVKLEQIQLLVVALNPSWNVSQSVHFFKDTKANESFAIRSSIECKDSSELETFSDEINLLVSYINKQGITRAFKRTIKIEPKLLIEKSIAQKEGSFKVTLSFSGVLEIKKMLTDLNIESSEQAIGLKPLNSDHNVTLISSKDSNRYRLQSNNLTALTLVLSICCNYITKTKDGKETKAATTNPVSATIEVFLASIEKYHKLKQEMKAVIENLGTRTIEMRLFERCFLAKMQEKSATHSTAGIDVLLRENFDKISALINQLRDLKQRTKRLQNQIASLIYFLGKVAEHVNLPNQKNREQLLSITRPITEFQDMSWVEAVAPSVDFIFSAQQLRKGGNQPYQNYSARSENFSFGKLSKQLKFILSGIADTEGEKALIEESEAENFENDWSARARDVLEEK